MTDRSQLPRRINIDDELNSIISRLNELNEQEQYMRYGVTDLAIALDIRADSWDEEGECPDPGPDELQQIQNECDLVLRNDAERDALVNKYYEISHTTPHLYPNGIYARLYGDS